MTGGPIEEWLATGSEDDAGPALAAAGVVAAAIPEHIDGPLPAADAAAIGDRLAAEDDDAIPWRNPTRAPGWDAVHGPIVAQWAAVWRQWQPAAPLRFAVDADLGGADAAWLTDRLTGTGVWAHGVYITLSEPPRPSPLWRFPLRVGFLDDDAGRALHSALEAATSPGSWERSLLDPVLIGAQATTADLILLPGAGGEALDAVRGVKRQPMTAVTVLIDPAADWALDTLEELRSATSADAVAVAPVADPTGWLIALGREITHDRHLDVAFRSVYPTGGFIAGPTRFFSTQRASKRAAVLAETLRRMETGARRDVEMAEAASVAADLDDIASHGAFANETGDASVLVEMERRAAPLVEGAAADRRLQAKITDEGAPERPLPGFRAGVTHDIEVRIGPQESDWLSAGEAFPEDLLPTEGPHRLTVVLTEPHLLETPEVGEIVLPATGASTTCHLTLTTRPDTTTVDARLIVLAGNRVLQTARLPSPVDVGAAHAGGRGLQQKAGNVAETETVVRAVSGTLSDRRPFDAAFVVNHGEDGASRATGVAGGKAAIVDLEDATVSEAIAKITRRLGEIVEQPEDFASLDADGSVELLVFLAHHGRLMRNALASDFLGDALAESRYLQVVSARPDAFLPFEFAYDFTAPGEDAGLCPDALTALASDAVDATCPGVHDATVVCPFGFWAVSKVIERQAFQPGGDVPRGFLVRGQPTRDRRRIALAPGAIFAASERVDEFAAGSIASVEQTLTTVAPRVTTAASWDDWSTGVAGGPAVLLLLPHTVYSETLDVFGLEIGHGDRRWAGDIDARLLPGDDRPVVAILLGCETAAAGKVGYERFPGLLRRAGAEVIVGTLTEVLGRHAAPVGQALTELLYALCETEPIGFGEVMQRLRRRMLAGGKLMVLTLAAFGDADWVLAREEA